MMWKTCILYTVLLYKVSTEYCEESLTRYLPDSSFSSSSSYTNIQDGIQYSAGRAKILDDVPGSWVAETIDTNQYIQIDLLRISLVTEIVTKGRSVDVYTGCCQQYVTSYSVQYSTNNKTWTQTTTSSNVNLFGGNTNTEDAVLNKLECPAIARYIRILPQTWQGHIAMRIDIRGCYIQSDSITSRQNNKEAVYPQLRDVNSSPGQRSWFGNLYAQSGPDRTPGLSNQQPSAGSRQPLQPSSNTRVFQGSAVNNQQPQTGFNNQQPSSGFNNQQPTAGFNMRQLNTDQQLQPQTKTLGVGGTAPSHQNTPRDNPFQQDNRVTRETTTQPWFARDWDPSVFKTRDESPPWRRTNWGNEYPFPQQGVISPTKNDRCIESCYNRKDGDYQSCRSCRVYVSCSNGYAYDQRLCPGNLVWNDDRKICDWTSKTCP